MKIIASFWLSLFLFLGILLHGNATTLVNLLPNDEYSALNIQNYLDDLLSRTTLTSCLYRMERYGGLRGDKLDDTFRNYDKALKAGQDCIDYGVEQTPAGWLTHLWMAYFYKQKGQQKKSADHTAFALKLDVHGDIAKLGLLKRYGLQK